jgi:hypothetical protein
VAMSKFPRPIAAQGSCLLMSSVRLVGGQATTLARVAAGQLTSRQSYGGG